MKIYVATIYPNKLKIVEKVFASVIPDSQIEVAVSDVESGVVGTPSENDNFLGSKNRAVNSLEKYSDGSYFVGLETGLVKKDNLYFEETWCVIANSSGLLGISYSSGNFINQDIKTRMINTDSSSSLEVYNNETETWDQYSGKLDFRSLEIKNCVECSLKLLLDLENKNE